MNQLEQSFSHNILKACYGQDGIPQQQQQPEALINFMIQTGIIKKSSIRDFVIYAEFNRLMALQRYRNKTVTVDALAMIFKLTPSTIFSILKKAEIEGPPLHHQPEKTLIS
ncbi:MAG: hypothetical protein AB8H47_27550 [Bacteroidia bacterium]